MQGGRDDRAVHFHMRGYGPPMQVAYGRRPGGLLSPEERRNLLVAIAVLTLCLTMAMFGGLYGLMDWLGSEAWFVGVTAVVALISASTGFLCHEMAHKFVAQRYGCWAEFRYSLQGLGIALVISALTPILYAAPGAVFIAGRIDQRQNGLISIAGPATNVLIAVALIPIVLVSGDLVAWAVRTVIFFNAFLAIFNMIPFMPLDGAKVLRWSAPVYVASVVVMGALLYFVYAILPDLAGTI